MKMKIVTFVNLILITNLVFVSISPRLDCINQETKQIVTKLKNSKIIKSKEVEKAFCSVNRADFMDSLSTKYDELTEVPSKYGITLASAKEHAIILEILLEKFRGKDLLRILDVTSGTGLL